MEREITGFVGEIDLTDEAGSEGFFVRSQVNAGYQDFAFDYWDNEIKGGVCALECEKNIGMDAARSKFDEIGLPGYIDPEQGREFLVYFEGKKYYDMPDGCVAGMDRIIRIWNIRTGNLEYDRERDGAI